MIETYALALSQIPTDWGWFTCIVDELITFIEVASNWG